MISTERIKQKAEKNMFQTVADVRGKNILSIKMFTFAEAWL